jgi:hypothetical protein
MFLETSRGAAGGIDFASASVADSNKDHDEAIETWTNLFEIPGGARKLPNLTLILVSSFDMLSCMFCIAISAIDWLNQTVRDIGNFVIA